MKKCFKLLMAVAVMASGCSLFNKKSTNNEPEKEEKREEPVKEEAPEEVKE